MNESLMMRFLEEPITKDFTMTIETIAKATQEQFDSMYSLGEIIKGDNIAMMTAARTIALRKLHAEESNYDTDTGLRLSNDDIRDAFATLTSGDTRIALDMSDDSVAHIIASSLFDYDETRITLSMTCDIVGDALCRNIPWQKR